MCHNIVPILRCCLLLNESRGELALCAWKLEISRDCCNGAHLDDHVVDAVDVELDLGTRVRVR